MKAWDAKGGESGEIASSRHGWMPLSLSTPILSAVIALTLLLAAVVETLAQRSHSQGGLELSPSLDEIPEYAKIGYRYLPMIVAVLYSMIWAWIDLDVKRMQPWFELSKPNGATAVNSLFLDYPYQFVALAPFQAATRKHWPVFFAGTAMVIVFWLLTPIQSALLGTATVTQSKLMKIATTSRLRPVEEQTTALTADILFEAYSIGWLSKPFPAFTTSSYALLPFYPEPDSISAGIERNLIGETTKLWTELNCWPTTPESHETDGIRPFFTFSNGKDCEASVLDRSLPGIMMLYLGYYTTDTYGLEGEDCAATEDNSHQFLVIWSKRTTLSVNPVDMNMTALFCQPSYYKQRVRVKVTSASFQPLPDSVEELTSKEPLLQQEFNSTAFEYILANGRKSWDGETDYPYAKPLKQDPRLQYGEYTDRDSYMTGIALAGAGSDLEELSSPDALEQVYLNAHQFLFSVAVSQILTNNTGTSNRTLSAEFPLVGIVVSRPLSIAVESLLAVVAIFSAALLWHCRTSPNVLPMNPSSISRHIDLFRDSPELLTLLRRMDTANEKVLLNEFRDDELRLLSEAHSRRTEFLIIRGRPKSSIQRGLKLRVQRGYFEPIRPLALRRWIGVLFIGVLVAAMITLSYLKQQEAKLNGLPRPSQNFEVLQLIENYLPTVFATLIEPYWILLNRLLCVLQPFKDLCKGRARSSHSIDVAYTSIPPQLVVWRAIKSKHFILTLVCTIALLANVLAVSLGSLFNEAPAFVAHTQTLQPVFAPMFSESAAWNSLDFYEDPMYIGLANLTSGTRLPPWVTQEYFFQRYTDTDPKPQSPEDTYTFQTRGFGARANCATVDTFDLPATLPNLYGPCFDPVDTLVVGVGSILGTKTEKLALEYTRSLPASQSQSCERMFLLGCGRNHPSDGANGTIQASFLICRPVFDTALFNITVATSGHVLSYNRTSDPETTLDYPEFEDHVKMVIGAANYLWQGPPRKHTTASSTDWMSHFLVVTSGSRDIIDPNMPVPDPKLMLPLVEDLYRRIFAIILSENEYLFEQIQQAEPTKAIRHTNEIKIFMQNGSFIVTMAILVMNMVVAIIFYTRGAAFTLPRLPTTLASLLAYVAPSRMATAVYKKAPYHESRTFSFGRYFGADGQAYLGIETDPHVVPIVPAPLDGDGGLASRVRRWFTRKARRGGKEESWL